MARRVWACSCGEQIEEDGTGHGMGLAGAHTSAGKKRGQAHKIAGLIDAETGEVLVSGLSMTTARKLGYVQAAGGAKARSKQFAGRATKESGASRADAAQARPAAVHAITEEEATRALEQERPKNLSQPQTVSNIRGVLETWTFVAPAPMFTLFIMGRQVIRRADGTEFPMTPDGFQEYIWEAFKTWHEEHMAFLLGLPQELPPQDVDLIIGRVMQRITDTTYLHLAQWNGGVSPLPTPVAP